MEWVGFAPLRKGRIHVFCPRCHRKLSNCPRGEYDPPRATLVHVHCERCGRGDKETSETFFSARGKQIPWEEVERIIERATITYEAPVPAKKGKRR